MPLAENPEHIHAELLEALYKARKQVELLESALAHNAAFLGAGVEREQHLGTPPPDLRRVRSLMEHLQLVEPEDDMSDYLGIEGDEASRPKLEDAPESLRPDTSTNVSPQIGQLVEAHPDDYISHIPGPEELVAFPGSESLSSWVSPDMGVSGMRKNALNAGSESQESISGTAPPASISTPAGNAPTIQAETPVSPLADARNTSDNFIRSALALQAINDGVWDWNLRSGEIFASERWLALLPGTDSPSASPLDCIAASLHPADAGTFKERFTGLLNGTCSRVSVAVRINHPGDARSWALLRAVCLRQGDTPLRLVAAIADITEQREAKIALKVSEEKFRTLAEDSADIIARFDEQHRFIYASPTISRYLAATPEHVLHRTFSSLNVEGDIAFFDETLSRVFELGLPVQVEVQMKSSLVGDFVAECRFWPEFDIDGHVVSVMCQIRDMTFFRRISGNYRALLNSMVDGFILFERIPHRAEGATSASATYGPDDFTLITMNPAFERMSGLDSGFAAGKRLGELLGEHAVLWADCLHTALVGKQPCQCSLRSHSLERIFDISAYSTEEDRVACIVKDVTELRAIEQELRLNESRFAALHDLSRMDKAPEDEVVRFALDKAVELTGSDVGFIYLEYSAGEKSSAMYWSTDPVPVGRWPGGKAMPQLEPEMLKIRKAEMVNEAESPFSLAVGGPGDISRYILAPVIEQGRVVCVAGVANKILEYEKSDLRQLEMFISGMWFLLRRRWALQALMQVKG